jgi:hypothetical protein
MDPGRFDRLARVLSARKLLSRRGMGGVAGTTASLALAGALAHVLKPVEIEAKQNKKKQSGSENHKNNSRRRKHGNCRNNDNGENCKSFCPEGTDSCADDVATGCGRGCVCRTGTSSTICGEAVLEECIPCEVDADCDAATGPGSVCQAEVGGCECEGQPRVCVPPCAEPLPAR